MTTETVNITNRTRNLGFGFSSKPSGRGTEIIPPGGPAHRGTYRQVLAAIASDKVLQSYRTGGTYYRTSWFVGDRRIVRWPSNEELVRMPGMPLTITAALKQGVTVEVEV